MNSMKLLTNLVLSCVAATIGCDPSSTQRIGLTRSPTPVRASTSPTDTAPTDTAPTDTSPTDTAPTDTTDTAPTDTSPTDTAPTDTALCHVGSLTGTCRDPSACAPDEVPLAGFCPPSTPRTRCCLPTSAACSAARAPGACLDLSLCPAPAFTAHPGLCPGPATTQCCTAPTSPPRCDPATLPTPNAGLPAPSPGSPGCPPGMTTISALPTVCIDRFEASLVLAADPSRSLSPYHHPGSTPARAQSIPWAVPQGNIDAVTAQAACTHAGKRLCTSTEWLAACRGPAAWTYPYGPTREPRRCNDTRPQHVAIELFGTTDPWIYSEIDNPCLAQLPASVALTGQFSGCVTPDGVYDLMGNLHEWVDDPDGTFRGGFFSDTRLNGDGCLYRTTAHDVNHHDYSTGFRCCADRTDP